MNTIKMLRKNKKGCTQQRLAQHMGVSRATIGHWESGVSQPDNQSLVKLSHFFNVPVDTLLGSDNVRYTLSNTEENILNIAKQLSKPQLDLWIKFAEKIFLNK